MNIHTRYEHELGRGEVGPAYRGNLAFRAELFLDDDKTKSHPDVWVDVKALEMPSKKKISMVPTLTEMLHDNRPDDALSAVNHMLDGLLAPAAFDFRRSAKNKDAYANHEIPSRGLVTAVRVDDNKNKVFVRLDGDALEHLVAELYAQGISRA